MNKELMALYVLMLKYDFKIMSCTTMPATNETWIMLEPTGPYYPTSAPTLKRNWIGKGFLMLSPGDKCTTTK